VLCEKRGRSPEPKQPGLKSPPWRGLVPDPDPGTGRVGRWATGSTIGAASSGGVSLFDRPKRGRKKPHQPALAHCVRVAGLHALRLTAHRERPGIDCWPGRLLEWSGTNARALSPFSRGRRIPAFAGTGRVSRWGAGTGGRCSLFRQESPCRPAEKRTERAALRTVRDDSRPRATTHDGPFTTHASPSSILHSRSSIRSSPRDDLPPVGPWSSLSRGETWGLSLCFPGCAGVLVWRYGEAHVPPW
jgi:hypothetical protein